MSPRSRPSDPVPLPWRSRAAVGIGRGVATASKLTGLGSGSVIGGRASLLIDPHLLGSLTAGRSVAVVSATNGKTTTTRLLSAALGADRPVVSNLMGANMLPGHVAALGGSDPASTVVLEADERWVGNVLAQTPAATVLLLNLSRDQLDRSHEVRKIADGWRQDFAAHPPEVVVANADDPLVTWAALPSNDTARPHQVLWVSTGSSWRADATGCPSCSGRLVFDDPVADDPVSDDLAGSDRKAGSDTQADTRAPSGWHCASCSFARPEPAVRLVGNTVVWSTAAGGGQVELSLSLPGRANRMNAAMALAAARSMGVDPQVGAAAMAGVDDVAGRYREATVDGVDIRLLLAKNPAGWAEALEMLTPAPRPVIISINARVADGHDPSWLWDVPFERLADRFVVATGERRHDLAVRLQYAEVDHVVADTLRSSVGHLRSAPTAGATERLDVAANYTAFQGYLSELDA